MREKYRKGKCRFHISAGPDSVSVDRTCASAIKAAACLTVYIQSV
ncbi:hypothetical protein CLOHYLEM_05382 [[Clostridium] hylemonae DSM 15053]|uniref:Uncharacterized protein n=1 Tax=[Clostridium] hylemonae DSM 15053 TaxID=553973 RepID=C0BZZ0_9FIRM|nr:hypothetical protein CLOHYLEM_05382 [[Clostridium] hylemonae DSM 15053]